MAWEQLWLPLVQPNPRKMRMVSQKDASSSRSLFSCHGDTRAVPSVGCECQEEETLGTVVSLNDFDETCDKASAAPCDATTQFLFRAESHFGLLTMVPGITAKCVLHCQMPTTDG